jgi:uncharacterized protein (TIGR00255 family)|tara:strand:- start:632 stop:1483 length:852 start_codon:yes stop_codon:yes gene_type:complete
MIASMTGFGSSKHIQKETEIYCDIKTVNHRFLDVSIKPNDIGNELDVLIREDVTKKIRRGSVDIRFKLKFPSSNKYSINENSVKNLLDSLKTIKSFETSSFRLSDIKDIPGIIKSEQKVFINQNLLKKTFKEALNQLLENRNIEGEKIKKTFLSKIIKVQKNSIKLSKSNSKLSKLRAESLNKKVKILCNNLDQDRLEQEIAILVLKHDVAEEIERIDFHLVSLKKELSIKNGSGKKIDFILQELFRETSTLSVKLDHPSYKQIALDMKLSVEEMREQAQNIE